MRAGLQSQVEDISGDDFSLQLQVRDISRDSFSVFFSLCFVLGGLFRLEGHYFCSRGFYRFLVAQMRTFP